MWWLLTKSCLSPPYADVFYCSRCKWPPTLVPRGRELHTHTHLSVEANRWRVVTFIICPGTFLDSAINALLWLHSYIWFSFSLAVPCIFSYARHNCWCPLQHYLLISIEWRWNGGHRWSKDTAETCPVIHLQLHHVVACKLHSALPINLSWTSACKEDLRCLSISGKLGQVIYLGPCSRIRNPGSWVIG